MVPCIEQCEASCCGVGWQGLYQGMYRLIVYVSSRVIHVRVNTNMQVNAHNYHLFLNVVFKNTLGPHIPQLTLSHISIILLNLPNLVYQKHSHTILHKKGNIIPLSNYRPISLEIIIYKLFICTTTLIQQLGKLHVALNDNVSNQTNSKSLYVKANHIIKLSTKLTNVLHTILGCLLDSERYDRM